MATEYKTSRDLYNSPSLQSKGYELLNFPTSEERWWHERKKHFNELEDYVDLYMIPFTD